MGENLIRLIRTLRGESEEKKVGLSCVSQRRYRVVKSRLLFMVLTIRPREAYVKA